MVEDSELLDQDVSATGPSSANSLRIENSVLESLCASLREEITSEVKALLMQSQKEMVKLLNSKTGESVREEDENDLENQTRSFYTPTKSVRINSTHNNDPCTSLNRRERLTSALYLRLK